MLRPAPLGVQLLHPVPDETQVERRIEVAVEVVGGDQLLERCGDGHVEAAGLGRAEQAGGTLDFSNRAPHYEVIGGLRAVICGSATRGPPPCCKPMGMNNLVGLTRALADVLAPRCA